MGSVIVDWQLPRDHCLPMPSPVHRWGANAVQQDVLFRTVSCQALRSAAMAMENARLSHDILDSLEAETCDN